VCSSDLKVFFFGGAEGVARQACEALNEIERGLVCVGWHDPGFGDVDAISSQEIISKINASTADFLSVSLGAAKGQAWLLKNHHRIKTSVRVHLGATINFQIGRVKRAPVMLRRVGLEWLWRIKEEPHLWRRYWADGCKLLQLLVGRALPLIILQGVARLERKGRDLKIACRCNDGQVVVSVFGSATARNIASAISPLRQAIAMKRPLVIDMLLTGEIDSRFIGLLLTVRKQTSASGGMSLVNVPGRISRILRLSGFEYLLTDSCLHPRRRPFGRLGD